MKRTVAYRSSFVKYYNIILSRDRYREFYHNGAMRVYLVFPQTSHNATRTPTDRVSRATGLQPQSGLSRSYSISVAYGVLTRNIMNKKIKQIMSLASTIYISET